MNTVAEIERMSSTWCEAEAANVEIVERAVLRSLACWWGEAWHALERVEPEARPEDFKSPRHQRLFLALAHLRADDEVPHTDAVARTLGDATDLAYWHQRIMAPEGPEGAYAHAPHQLDMWLLAMRRARTRERIRAAAADVAQGHDGAVAALVEAQQACVPRAARVGPETASAALAGLATRMRAPDEGGPLLTWRVPEFRRAKMRRTDFAIVAARPSVGKSTWLLRWAVETSVAMQRAVLWASLEDDPDVLWEACICAEAGVPRPDDEHPWTPEQGAAAVRAEAWLREKSHLVIPEQAPARLPTFLAWAKRKADEHRPVATVVDYLGLLASPGRSDYERQTETSRAVRHLARELGIAVIGIHQLNRASANEGRRPTMADLRGSGQYEQDATHVILGHRPYEALGESKQAEHDARDPGYREERWWTLVKCKRGPAPCRLRVRYDPTTSRFGRCI